MSSFIKVQAKQYRDLFCKDRYYWASLGDNYNYISIYSSPNDYGWTTDLTMEEYTKIFGNQGREFFEAIELLKKFP